MTTIKVPIGEAGGDLPSLIERVESGDVRVCLTSDGTPKALIVPWTEQGEPWRADHPADPSRYGDLQSPVLD